jgi:hypothetical protein
VQQVVATSWLTSAALLGVLGLASNPDYYLLATVTLLFVAIAYANLRVLDNKRLLLISYLALAVYGFVVGRTLFHGGRLSSGGVFAIVVIMPVVGYLIWRLYKTEAAAA